MILRIAIFLFTRAWRPALFGLALSSRIVLSCRLSGRLAFVVADLVLCCICRCHCFVALSLSLTGCRFVACIHSLAFVVCVWLWFCRIVCVSSHSFVIALVLLIHCIALRSSHRIAWRTSVLSASDGMQERRSSAQEPCVHTARSSRYRDETHPGSKLPRTAASRKSWRMPSTSRLPAHHPARSSSIRRRTSPSGWTQPRMGLPAPM